MQETLLDHHSSISIDGRPICNLRFADDIDLMGSSNSELQDLTNRLVNKPTAFGMEVSIENSNILINSTNNVGADISMNGQKLEEVTSFKHLGATLCKEMAPAQQKSASGLPRSGGATLSALQASSSSRSLLSSPSSSTAVKHGPSMLTLKLRIHAFETKCMGKPLRISYLEHKINDWVRRKINVQHAAIWYWYLLLRIYVIFFICIAFAHSFFIFLFFILLFLKDLAFINQRKGPRYQCVLSVCAFLTGAIPKRHILRKCCV